MPEQSAAALNPIIKVMNLVAILIAPLVAVPWSGWVRAAIVVATLSAIATAITVNRRRTGAVSRPVVPERSSAAE